MTGMLANRQSRGMGTCRRSGARFRASPERRRGYYQDCERLKEPSPMQ